MTSHRNITHYKYFIGHKKPDFPIWKNFTFYETPKPESHIQNESFKSNSLNSVIFGEYSSLFSLKDNLKDKFLDDGLITLCQYRRFVFNRKMGRKSNNLPYCMVLSHDEITKLDVMDEYLPLPGNSFLLPQAISVPSVMQQYSEAHFLSDILKFTSKLIELEILSENQALEFLSHQYLIPAPSCGTYPTKVFTTIIDIIETAAKGFWNSGYKPYYDPYQCRVMAFLLERLHSFLLFYFIKNSSIDIEKLFGVITLAAPINAKTIDLEKGSAYS